MEPPGDTVSPGRATTMSTDLDREDPARDGITLVSREDVLALAAAYGRIGRRTELWGTAGVIGGLAVGALLLELRGGLGGPNWLDPVFFGVGWAMAIVSAVVAWRHQRKELSKYQFACPGCNAPLLSARPWRTEISRAQLAASTGVCPDCGQRLFE